MLSSIKALTTRTAILAATGLVLSTAGMSRADDAPPPVKSAFSFSGGTDFTSHFISYGVDVWGGGNQASPFAEHATNFIYGTLNCALTDNVSAFIGIWADHNNNVPSGLGGEIQEIDVNTGLNFTAGKFVFGISHGFWNYAADTEKVVDLTAGYNDSDTLVKGLALNPSLDLHYRYDGDGGQETGGTAVFGLKPSYTFLSDSNWPVTFSVPLAGALFTDGFQGGGSGYGYASAGIALSVPMKFIPAKFGTYTASVSETYYNTNDYTIPGNPSSDFFVTDINLNFAQ